MAVLNPEQLQGSIQIASPAAGEKLKCKLEANGGFFELRGTSKGIDSNRTLVLFVDPNDPGTYGWFVQLDPNGVDLSSDGTWVAHGQIGNKDYLPKNGKTIHLILRALRKEEADDLIKPRLADPRRANEGIRPQNIPTTPPGLSNELRDVELEVK